MVQKKSFTTKQLEDLFTACQHGMINLDDVLGKVDTKRKS